MSDDTIKPKDHAKGQDDSVKGQDDSVKGQDDSVKGQDDSVKGQDDSVTMQDNPGKSGEQQSNLLPEPKDRMGKLVYSPKYNNPDKLLSSLNITNNGRPFVNVKIEELSTEIISAVSNLKRLDLSFRFWEKDKINEKDFNLVMVEFDEKKNRETTRKHISYILTADEIYKKQGINLKMYFRVIYGPNVKPTEKVMGYLVWPYLSAEGQYLMNTYVNNSLKTIEDKIGAREELRIEELYAIVRFPELTKPVSENDLKKVIDLIFNSDIIIKELRTVYMQGVVGMNQKRLSLKQWKKFWENSKMKTTLDVALMNARKEGIKEAIEETKIADAVSLLERKFSLEDVIDILGVPDDLIQKIEAKMTQKTQ
ncbi:MAG: hypothetical protein LBE27_00720 [Deltaproteobacteria bacterium]|jgi:hypothetical protein|nr:hypothetical protein [Deltaproteobacteria bacterium]